MNKDEMQVWAQVRRTQEHVEVGLTVALALLVIAFTLLWAGVR